MLRRPRETAPRAKNVSDRQLPLPNPHGKYRKLTNDDHADDNRHLAVISNVRTLNDFLVPGMLNLSIAHVLLLLTEHCYTMQESQMLAQTILNRLLFLRFEVENKPIGTRIQSDLILKYGELVGNVLQFLRRYSTKTLVARIAANRRFLEGMKAYHKRIDYFFSKVNLSQRAEMRDWESNWDQDLTLQHLLFERFLSNKLVVRAELTDRGLEEALTELRFELAKPTSDQQKDFMEKVVNTFKYHHKMFAEPVPEWFVSRDEIQYKQEPFAIGTYGAVHRGSFERNKTRVVIKCMYSDSKQTQQAIYGEGELCSRLDHPNVLKMKGGCYVGSPMFLLFEDAGDRRSFDFYFSDSEKNKQKLWALFLETVEGLSYMHAKGIVHNNLKCSNLLVGVDGRTKLCDFGFSYDMNTKIVKKHTTAVRWKAPELLTPSATIPEAVVAPTFASDMYSLGMSIIEAVTGSLPWGPETSDQVIVKRTTAEGYTRPSGFTDQQWELVESLCAVKAEDRIALPEVIKKLKELIRLSEGRPVESLKTCGKCSSSNPAKNKFCNECGNRFLWSN